MGIYPALEGCLALGSLQMYEVSVENCLQKQIWYINMWDTDYLIYFQGFLIQKFLFKGGRGWKFIYMKRNPHFIGQTSISFPHFFVNHTNISVFSFVKLSFTLCLFATGKILYSCLSWTRTHSFLILRLHPLSNSSQKPCIILIC